MSVIDIIESLMNFSLTRQEANVYLLLLKEGELNGYKVSKITGISRSNAYNALASLVEKGAAYKIKENAVMYTPVDVEEFCNNKIRMIEAHKENLLNNIPKKKEESDGYITIRGKNHIIDKMKNIIIDAKERVYISLTEELLHIVFNELNIALENKIKVVIITDKPINNSKAIVYLKTKKNFDFSDKDINQVRLIADSKKVLTGDIEDTCLYSSNNNLVDVFKESLTNEIKLIELNRGRDN